MRDSMKHRGSERRRLGNGEQAESAEKEEKTMNRKKFNRKLVKYEALPEYLKENEFIRGYYRCEWPLKDTALSVFSFHNQTLNIWIHIVGSMIFAALAVMRLTTEKMPTENFLTTVFSLGATMKSSNSTTNFPESILSGDVDAVPKWPLFVFLLGTIITFLCSSATHLFACHSQKYARFFRKLDYSVLILLIIITFAPTYYTFSCQPHWRLFYLTSITTLGVTTIISFFSPTLSSNWFDSFRATIFVTMGLIAVFAAAHAATLYHRQSEVVVALGYEIAMGLLYAAGVVVYAARIPERLKPGAFDVVGASHQIAHVLFVAGALVHSVGVLAIMDWRRGLSSCSDALLG